MVKPFAVRHFTVLQYFEFCPVESDEKCFECYAWISYLHCVQRGRRKGQRSNFFHFLETLEDSK